MKNLNIDNSLRLVLLGLNDFTAKYIRILKESGQSVECIIDSGISNTEYEGLPVISPEKYKADAKKYLNYPVVITNEFSEKGDFNFVETLRTFDEFVGETDVQFLHPSFISDLVELNFQDKALVIGCNRSGSTLLFHVIKTLLDKKKVDISEKEQIIENIGKNHYNNLLLHLDSCFSNELMFPSATSATNFGHIDYCGGMENAFFFISPLPSKRFYFDKIHRTYSLLDDNIINQSKRIGSHVFFPMRNPFDVILSNAFELENVLFHMYPNEVSDEFVSDIRMQYGKRFLCDLSWFEKTAILVKKYFEAYLEHQKRVFSIRYEDVIMKPLETIKKIAAFIEVDVDDLFANQLWDKIGFKPLTSYKSHMFKPGQGKWKQYFTKDHFQILEALGYKNLMKTLGYPIDLHSTHNPNICVDVMNDESVKKLMSVRDVIFSLQFHKEFNYLDENMHIDSQTISQKKFTFVTNKSEFRNKFYDLKKSKTFQKAFFPKPLIPNQLNSINV